MVTLLYKVFIGLLLATCVGVGIAAFYTAPLPPQYPAPAKLSTLATPEPDPAAQAAYEQASRQYEAANKTYNRNVAALTVSLAVIILIISLTWLKSTPIFADGFMLGGVFTLIYGIIRSFQSGEQKFMFLVVVIGLGLAMALGYIKFLKPQEGKAK